MSDGRILLPGAAIKQIVTRSGVRRMGWGKGTIGPPVCRGQFQTAFLRFWMQLVAHLRQWDVGEVELFKSFHIVTGTALGGGGDGGGGFF